MASPCRAVSPGSCSTLSASPIPTLLPQAPLLCFPWLLGWEKEQGTPGPTHPCLQDPGEDGTAHPDQEWHLPSLG